MKNKWISIKHEAEKSVHGSYRKLFMLSKIPACAPLRIAANHLYKLYVNGQFAMTGPARSPATYRFVDVIDIAGYLKSGKNVLAVEVMTLWPVGEYCTPESGFCLELPCAGIVSDGSWKCHNWGTHFNPGKSLGGVRSYPAELVDARKIDWNWINMKFDDSNWETPEKSPAPPLRERSVSLPTLNPGLPKKIHDAGLLVNSNPVSGTNAVECPGALLAGGEVDAFLISHPHGVPYMMLDWGKTVCALHELEVCIPDGVRLECSYVEFADRDFGVAFEKNKRARHGFTLIGNGHWLKFQTFHPYSCRYLLIWADGLAAGEDVAIRHAGYREICTLPLCQTGELVTSDNGLNRIIEAAKGTLRACTPDYFVDCSSHERQIYLGDSYWAQPLYLIFFNEPRILDTMLDMILERKNLSPAWSHAPGGVAACKEPNPAHKGGVIKLFILQCLLQKQYTGKPLPERAVKAIELMLNDYEDNLENGFILHRSNAGWGGDWSRIIHAVDDTLPSLSTLQAASEYSALALLGEDGNQRAAGLAKNLRTRLQALLNPFVESDNYQRLDRCLPDLFVLDPETGELVPHRTPEASGFANCTLNRSEATANVVLHSGILDEAHTERLWKVLRSWRVNEIQRRDDTRFYAMPRANLFGLWPRMDFARARRDAEVLYRDLRDAVGIMADEGDGLWETLTPHYRSNSHGYNAFAGVLLFEALTGIRPGKDGGYSHCRIEPLLDGTVNWSRGHLTTPNGIIGVSWRYDGDSFVMNVGLPEGIDAMVTMPPLAAEILARGRHKIECDGCFNIDSSTIFRISLKEGFAQETIREGTSV